MNVNDLDRERILRSLSASGATRREAERHLDAVLEDDPVDDFEERMAEADEDRILEGFQFLAEHLFYRRMESGGDVQELEKVLRARLLAAREGARSSHDEEAEDE